MNPIDALVDAFMTHHLEFNPVDATFMGLPGHDDRLPPADRDAPSREAARIAELRMQLASIAAPSHGGTALDVKLMRAALDHAARALDERPRFRDPTWYVGEAAFGIISLLLPLAVAPTSDALAARLAQLPRFLAAAPAHLTGAAAPLDWVARAQKEIRALQRLLQGKLQIHPIWRASMASAVDAALIALVEFDRLIAALPDADPRCGTDYLNFIMREIHALPVSPAEAEAMAVERCVRVKAELASMAATLDPGRSWAEQLADLHKLRPAPDQIVDAYRSMHEEAMAAASGLVTPATEFGLEFKPLPQWAQGVAGDLYFLNYRSPAAFGAGAGSVYWTSPPGQSSANIKSTHAVHHGSIGHHTQNTRARVAPSRLARLANTGTARGIAFLSAGTMGEGWACYAQDLMAEIPGFYSPAETLLAKSNELRNASCLIADIRLHTRRYTLEEMRHYYGAEAGFPAERIWGETVKNSLFPGVRLMYWLGTEAIKQARARWSGDVRSFHDGLLARGHVAIAWAVEDLGAAVAQQDSAVTTMSQPRAE